MRIAEHRRRTDCQSHRGPQRRAVLPHRVLILQQRHLGIGQRGVKLVAVHRRFRAQSDLAQHELELLVGLLDLLDAQRGQALRAQ